MQRKTKRKQPILKTTATRELLTAAEEAGATVEVDPKLAETLGYFEEEALSEDDAYTASLDPVYAP